jgi:hypothetical protein
MVTRYTKTGKTQPTVPTGFDVNPDRADVNLALLLVSCNLIREVYIVRSPISPSFGQVVKVTFERE